MRGARAHPLVQVGAEAHALRLAFAFGLHLYGDEGDIIHSDACLLHRE